MGNKNHTDHLKSSFPQVFEQSIKVRRFLVSIAGFVQVPVTQLYWNDFVFKPIIQLFGNKNRAMAASGTTDGNG
jgi:hypothetical protein